MPRSLICSAVVTPTCIGRLDSGRLPKPAMPATDLARADGHLLRAAGVGWAAVCAWPACGRPARPAAAAMAQGAAAPRRCEVLRWMPSSFSVSMAGRPAPARRRRPFGACFPARGLPQSGSKGLSQSMPPCGRTNTPSEVRRGEPRREQNYTQQSERARMRGPCSASWRQALSRRPATPRPAPCAASGWWWCTAAGCAFPGRCTAPRRRRPAPPRGSPTGSASSCPGRC